MRRRTFDRVLLELTRLGVPVHGRLCSTCGRLACPRTFYVIRQDDIARVWRALRPLDRWVLAQNLRALRIPPPRSGAAPQGAAR